MSNTETHERGRPPEVAPPGFVTIKQAAEQASVSYATAYRAVVRDHVRYQQEANGTIYIVLGDVSKIKPVKRKRAKKPSVTIRTEPDRMKRWEAVAGDRSVGDWLGELADKAVARVERK